MAFVYPVIYIWPAFVANGAPVILGGGRPIDLGRKFLGRRIFGDHKTIRGFAAGVAAGSLMGLLESAFLPYMLLVGVALGFGAMGGDLLGSFVKRRIGIREGTRMLLLDQYPFLVIALLLAFPLGRSPGLYGIVFIVILTGAMHVLTNFYAHRLKLKKVPW